MNVPVNSEESRLVKSATSVRAVGLGEVRLDAFFAHGPQNIRQTRPTGANVAGRNAGVTVSEAGYVSCLSEESFLLEGDPMSQMFWTMLAVLGVALAYIWIPAGISTYRTVRAMRTCRCPQTGDPVHVRLDALRAGLATPVGLMMGLRVLGCSEWPGRAGCDRACTKNLV